MSTDLEEELDAFFIRKTVVESGNNIISDGGKTEQLPCEKIYKHVPLLLSDVQNLEVADQITSKELFYAFNRSVLIDTFVAHARVVGRLNDTDAYRAYLIDDSTATLELKVFKMKKDMEAACRLEDQLNSMADHVRGDDQNLFESMRSLVTKTKDNCYYTPIEVGSNVLLHGRPTWFRNEMSINALDIISDMDSNRNVELTFKDHLIKWYTQKYSSIEAKMKECEK